MSPCGRASSNRSSPPSSWAGASGCRPPWESRAATRAASKSKPRPDWGARAGRTILVVDDEELVVRVVELTLERGGFRPLLARTGQEAVALFEAHHQTIEAVILDLKLPGMSGGDVLERMRTLDAAVKVLVSTAYDEAEALAMIRGAGISGFIRKPYTSQMLLEKVRQVVGKG